MPVPLPRNSIQGGDHGQATHVNHANAVRLRCVHVELMLLLLTHQKCTGQPSPCEACEKIGLSCHFDSKTNWKTRTRATYSAEDGKLQYMLNAILSALKYSDEKVLDGLMTALRQNEPPEVIAMHLRSNIDTLREHGHISNMTIDQADLISLAIRISGADTSDAIPQDGDPDFETPHYQTTTMDINFSNSEGNTQMTSGEHIQQADMGNHMRHHSSMDPEWNPAFSITPNSGQSSSSPWNQTQFFPTEISHQGYYDNQWINFIQGPNVMPPGDMGQLYYASSHNTVQSDSEPNQFYMQQQYSSMQPPATSINEAGQHLGRSTPGSLAILHEDGEIQFDPNLAFPLPRRQ